MFSIRRLQEIINLLPKEINPRIGGSCALYFYGEVDTYRDVDIIVDSIDNVNLPFPKIEFIHPNRLNRGIKYCIDGQEVDILERLTTVSVIVHSTISSLPFEELREVHRTKELINNFIKKNKDENLLHF